MTHVRKLLAAMVLALPAAGFAMASAQAEPSYDRGHHRAYGYEHSGGHRVHSDRGHEVDRRHARDDHHAVRRHHSWWDFVTRRHHDRHH
ncbi:MAG: hypothetical protein K2X43_14575 [Hyphomonadaceae bacterium]|nr:hypothetical protein [Hyphomonadaceae bacterium]